ncbi:MAG: Fe-S biogenesis protein NfuA [Pseudomonadota bacterium]|nr:Fe-S biogenesis protein NfuA [Pseudomonadota bacterium]
MTGLTITESAQGYIAELLSKQDEDSMHIRVFVADPGTPRAESCVAYCRAEDAEPDDLVIACEGFNAYVEARSLPFLDEALIDYAKDRFGGQLTIKAPNAKIGKVDDSSPLEDRINYVLYTEINPGLAAHGGEVSLVEIIEGEGIAVLQFGGGCQGCGMVDATLKHGVERTLVEQVPEIRAVRDVTDHSMRENAYYT